MWCGAGCSFHGRDALNNTPPCARRLENMIRMAVRVLNNVIKKISFFGNVLFIFCARITDDRRRLPLEEWRGEAC